MPMLPRVARAHPARLVLLFALALLALGGTNRATGSAPAPDLGTSNYEIRFMENMIDHHAMAVMMAGICQQNAVHAELLAMCQSIEATQTQEIATMQSWLAAWYSLAYAPQMSQGSQQQMARLASLSGAVFEIAFMEMMIRHHWKAIVRAAQCVDRAYHDELIAMCEDIIVAQSAEIEQMRNWLCQWYGRCNYGPKASLRD
jgi:uncharacterized protein (DUF305 family)